MDPQFWHDRWAADQIGFNQEMVNPYLIRNWEQLTVKRGDRVLVPLCGKSVDMNYLQRRGHYVVGVELSEKAIFEYFTEAKLQPVPEERGEFTVYCERNIEIWCGDFFALTAKDIGNCTAFYDRAALIALPAEVRWRYVQHLNRLMAEDSCGFLVTLDYDQSQIDGPPFSVNDDEVQQLLSPEWRLKMVEEEDVLDKSEKFKKAGATRLTESAYRMFRR